MIDCMSGPAETCEWPTPQDFFDAVNAEFKFALDVCATNENAKCGRFFTLKENGLEQSWSGMCWTNPPYGVEIPRWMKKAYDAACSGEATVCCLVPARTDVAWFHEFCGQAEIRFIRGRLTFVGSDYPAPFPTMLVIFHAHLDPGGVVRLWDWRNRMQQRFGFQELTMIAADGG